MTNISDVSTVLSDYMLKGWVLTDQSCRSCSVVPLLRSPIGRIPVVNICANCDGDPKRVSQSSDSTSISTASSISRNDTISRSSTPATEISSRPGSPAFVVPVETPERRRRREQSDQASSEIGRRLLRGWALLGDECLNEGCFGVPLMRRPKTGGEKDPRKECVICGRVYVNEGELAEEELSVPSAAVETVVDPPSLSANPRVVENIQPLRHLDRPAEVATLATSNISALNVTTHALEKTLLNLSERLLSLTDPQSMSAIVDTISKTAQALSEVKKLERQVSFT